MRRIASVLVVAAVMTGAAATAAELKGSAKHCSVPPDFAVSDGAGLPEDKKKFLGSFGGYWADALYHTLLVARVRDDGSATVFYAYEKYEPWNIPRPGCSTFSARIDDGVLRGKLRNGVDVQYRFSGPHTLDGRYDRNGQITEGTFERLD